MFNSKIKRIEALEKDIIDKEDDLEITESRYQYWVESLMKQPESTLAREEFAFWREKRTAQQRELQEAREKLSKLRQGRQAIA